MTTNRYSHVASAVLSVPWAIHPPVMDVIVEVLGHRIAGERFTEEELADRVASGRAAGPRPAARTQRAGAVGQIGIYGVIAHRAEYFAETSTQGTSVQALASGFRTLMADPEVSSILFDVDSPGGQMSGVPELADEILAARGQKPFVAISDTLMASAALWLASAADEIVVTPSSLTGSVGVVMGHADYTGQLEQDGVKVTLVHAGQYKVETYPEVSLTEEARTYMQGLVDEAYGLFTKAVSRGRGITAATVRETFGQGRVLSPPDAVKVGMADRVDTYDNTIRRLAAGKVPFRSDRSAAAPDGVATILAVERVGDLRPELTPDESAAFRSRRNEQTSSDDVAIAAQAAVELARKRAAAR